VQKITATKIKGTPSVQRPVITKHCLILNNTVQRNENC